MDKKKREDEILGLLQRMRAPDDVFCIECGRGITGDVMADRQLAHDIAEGMNVRDALTNQRTASLHPTSKMDVILVQQSHISISGMICFSKGGYSCTF